MKKILKEYKDFISSGNLVEIAVAFILALALKAVVDAFTEGIVLNLVAGIVGEPSFNDITIDVGDSQLLIGAFINAVIQFLAVAWVLFLILKAYNKFRPPVAKAPDAEVVLLTEIRDALRARGPVS